MKRVLKFIFKKLLKILIVLAIVAVILLIVGWLFIKLYKPLGGVASKKEQEDYARRSSAFKNGKFYNEDFKLHSNYKDPYADRTTGKSTTPKDTLKAEKFEFNSDITTESLLVTWFGHSTVLLQMHGLNILIDPVFSNRISPVSFAGPKRFSELAATVDDLPDIDIVVLTHDHYDHEDYNTLKQLKSKTKKFIVPLGVEKDLEKFGIDKSKITNMAWWEEVEVDGLTIAATPSRHFSGRYILDNDTALWCGYIFKDERNTVYNSGDGGYGSHFKEINEKYGKVDLALIETGQYNTEWHDVHLFPEEAVEAVKDVDATISMPVHWGAFVLSSHSWDDPVSRFTRRAKEENRDYITPKLGQTVNLMNYDQYQEEWWKDIE